MKTKASDKSGTEAEEIDIFFSRELIKVTYGNTTIVSKLIDDSFPNYESVIPTDNEKILKINRADLLDSLKRSIVMSDPITNKINFTIISDELKISASNTEYGTDADETIKCSFTEKEDFEIAFNGRYLIEALQSYETDEVLFDINSPLKAVIIRPSEQNKDEDVIMLIMPVRNI
jgi:DNA polymerase-3 subunit beta